MSNTENTVESTRFTSEESARLHRLVSTFPYTGGGLPPNWNTKNVDGVIAVFAHLREVVLNAATRANAERRELEALKQDIAAVRRVFGIEGVSQPLVNALQEVKCGIEVGTERGIEDSIDWQHYLRLIDAALATVR